ncbi:hypothetical protein HMPREF0530_2735 [Lacticaseibacillus paracasei subsp. paracasei ATCC 25302 = DSM 5622 = JCM 8130]|nr:hypothetical protein HMPREF0530_2735 [Lacticaseibacillus paracasei subsp. paracasei ATCC 25302 = DSM 5622 = JCM 8130]EPC30524.1 hypothetical protein Lpp120_2129 [Lacticaseibacillus paracasei subsp. paracasei Lpp120]
MFLLASILIGLYLTDCDVDKTKFRENDRLCYNGKKERELTRLETGV